MAWSSADEAQANQSLENKILNWEQLLKLAKTEDERIDIQNTITLMGEGLKNGNNA